MFLEDFSVFYLICAGSVGFAIGILVALLATGRRRARLERELALAARDRDRNAEDLKRLSDDRASLAVSFRELTEEILRNREESLVATNGKNLKLILDPLRHDFEGLQHLVQEARAAGKTDMGSLQQQVVSDLKLVREIAARVDLDARGLSAALRGNINVRGQWGEAVLEQLLNHSGLVKGVHYATQVALSDDDGRFRPDVVVHTPGGAEVVIDSKVNLASYLDYIQAEDPKKGETALSELGRQVRTEMKALADRRYQKRVEKSIDYVILFMPVEGAYQAIVASSPELLSEAMERRIILAGPTMLIAILSLVMRLWVHDEQGKCTKQILDCAHTLAERVIAFATDLENAGAHIDKAREAYQKALHRLQEGGSGSVVTTFRKLEGLQGKTGKKPPSILEDEDAMAS